LRLDITMNKVSLTQEMKGARKLFKEMSNNDLVKGSAGWIGVFGDHISGRGMVI
jgi:hypothetical protein